VHISITKALPGQQSLRSEPLAVERQALPLPALIGIIFGLGLAGLLPLPVDGQEFMQEREPFLPAPTGRTIGGWGAEADHFTFTYIIKAWRPLPWSLGSSFS
jgi:hypothetical protein